MCNYTFKIYKILCLLKGFIRKFKRLSRYNTGTGRNCTKNNLHEASILHEDKFALGDKIARRVSLARE